LRAPSGLSDEHPGISKAAVRGDRIPGRDRRRRAEAVYRAGQYLGGEPFTEGSDLVHMSVRISYGSFHRLR
jgi:hypothetical protein